jgi:hypothetical protein
MNSSIAALYIEIRMKGSEHPAGSLNGIRRMTAGGEPEGGCLRTRLDYQRVFATRFYF